MGQRAFRRVLKNGDRRSAELLRARFYHGAKIRLLLVFAPVVILLGSAFPKPCFVLTNSISFVSPQAAKLAHSVVRPLPTQPAFAGLVRGPHYNRRKFSLAPFGKSAAPMLASAREKFEKIFFCLPCKTAFCGGLGERRKPRNLRYRAKIRMQKNVFLQSPPKTGGKNTLKIALGRGMFFDAL